MAVGYLMIGWILGASTALLAYFGYGISALACFGLFVGTSVLAVFLVVLLAAWRMGCFAEGASRSPAFAEG